MEQQNEPIVVHQSYESPPQEAVSNELGNTSRISGLSVSRLRAKGGGYGGDMRNNDAFGGASNFP